MQSAANLITVEEALSIVLQTGEALPPETTPLATSALGLILAENVTSDLDMPPYDKSLMDGYAIRVGDLQEGQGTLEVIEEVTAGKQPKSPIGEGQATRIMTGAPIPEGTEAIVMHERTTLNGNRVEINDPGLKEGQNILRQGSEMIEGDLVLAEGATIRPPEMGLLATVGKTAVQLIPPPRVAIVSTGDELVEPMMTPRPGQIRNGNGPMLVGQVSQAGGLPRNLGIARDEKAHLHSLIKEGLEAHILVLSGGVSAGKLDLVPGVLEELGVEGLFHKVQLKPGKPVFFGVLGREKRPSTLVFGLPGNPVSALVCFELFVCPAIRKLKGQENPEPVYLEAELVEDFAYRTDRPTYHPAQLVQKPLGWGVKMIPWLGSPDLCALTNANALACLPVGDHTYSAGTRLSVLPLS